MTPLRVCILTETFHPVVGGGETQARLLADGLVADGMAVIIMTRRTDRLLAKVERFDDITVYRLPPVGSGQLKKWGLVLSGFIALISLRHSYDLVFVSGFRIVGMTAVIVGRLLHKRVVLKADSQGEMSGAFFKSGLARIGLSPRSLPFALFLRWRNRILRQASAFVAITADVAAELTAAGVRTECIHMIPNGVDTNRFYPVSETRKQALRRDLGLPPAGKLVIYTGRLVSYKGLPLLLEVWRELSQIHASASLLLVGAGGLDIHNCEEELRDYVQTNNLQRSVFFAGSVQNVQEYVQASDVFVLPTKDDALPSSLIEAMACRLAVVATPVGAIKEIIHHQQNGLLVQPGDFQQLYDALSQLLEDTSLSVRLGQGGWQTVQNRYAAAAVTQQYAQLFWNIGEM